MDKLKPIPQDQFLTIKDPMLRVSHTNDVKIIAQQLNLMMARHNELIKVINGLQDLVEKAGRALINEEDPK